ncbi:predicted signal transduction protein [Photobacterium aphoticum]|uniref:Predicted signal transduction protein n=1 Tax=Photobacterium aphoticum TaxID=754436 RepID=A0A090RDK6_9GAMM|nr:predicted signal transduction protein [Photobacterium aphoticum]
MAIRHLYRMGYMIALDDFEMDPRWARFLPYVHIIKLDLMKLGLAAACEFVANNRHRKLMFLAEKVETQDEFNVALDAGFHFFQGYFFSRPQVLKIARSPRNGQQPCVCCRKCVGRKWILPVSSRSSLPMCRCPICCCVMSTMLPSR